MLRRSKTSAADARTGSYLAAVLPAGAAACPPGPDAYQCAGLGM